MKKEHWLIPLGILSVVVAIWAALRKTNSNPTVIVQTSPSLAPGIAPIPSATVDPHTTAASVPGPVVVQTQAPSAASAGVPSFAAQNSAGGSPIPAPAPVNSKPIFYGPVRDFINSMIPNTDHTPPYVPKKSACGCGGGCNDGCTSKCASNNARFPDGRGGCLAFNRRTQIDAMTKAQPTIFMAAAENLSSSDVKMFDVYQQSVFDNEVSRGYVAASPFHSPV